MEYNLLENLIYCQSSVTPIKSLVLYSHIIPMATAMIISLFVFFKNRSNYLSRILLLISFIFLIWSLLDLSLWIDMRADMIMFAWAPLETLSMIGFMLVAYFAYYSVKNVSPPKIIKIIGFVLVAITALISSTALNLSNYNMNDCVAVVSNSYTYGTFAIDALITLSIVIFLIHSAVKKVAPLSVVVPLSIGIGVFFYTFTLASLISSYIDDYRVELYGLLSMFVFTISLAYIVVRGKIFNVKLIASQALVAVLAIVTAAQFVYLKNISSIILASITFLFVIISGILLVKSVKREIEARNQIEELAVRLRSVNKVLSHDVKGALGKHAMLFRALADGDFGPVPDQARTFIEQSAKDATKLVDAIMIMLQSGHELTFHPTKFDMGALVKEIVEASKSKAEKKGLILNLKVDDTSSLLVELDQSYIKMHVVQNLISNAINYTLKGNIDVYIGKSSESKIMFSVKDSGIGISASDAPRMFSEGGHGEHSSEVNVHSTGYGLFSAKRVVDACGGKIWFDSKGIVGEGTTFFVELPLVAQTTEEKVVEQKII